MTTSPKKRESLFVGKLLGIKRLSVRRDKSHTDTLDLSHREDNNMILFRKHVLGGDLRHLNL